jgi:Zn-finger nucleic acid-binding protein
MKTVGEMGAHEILIELKYCERCGGLWLRPQGADAVYCAGCQVHVEARQNRTVTFFPKPRPRKGCGQEICKQRGDLHGSGRIDYLEGVATIEVRG